MDIKLFAVFKTAIYRHACGGIFSTREAAVKAAVELRDGECDGHHNYVVVPFILNEKTDQTPLINNKWGRITGGELKERGDIFDSECKDADALLKELSK